MWQQSVPTMLAHWWESLERMMWLITNLEVWNSSLKPYPRTCLCCLILRWRSWPSVLLPFDSGLQSVRTPSFLFLPTSKALFPKANSSRSFFFFERNLPSEYCKHRFHCKIKPVNWVCGDKLTLSCASKDHDLISFVSFRCRIWEYLKRHE